MAADEKGAERDTEVKLSGELKGVNKSRDCADNIYNVSKQILETG